MRLGACSIAVAAAFIVGCGGGDSEESASLSIDEINACLESADFRTTVRSSGYALVFPGRPPRPVPAIDVGAAGTTPPTVSVLIADPNTKNGRRTLQVYQVLGAQKTAPNVLLVPRLPDPKALKPDGPGVRSTNKRPSLDDVPRIDEIRQCASTP